MASEETHHIPDLIHDATSGTTYKKGRFLGKGGFAMCYEITNTRNNLTYAGKIVSKKLMTKHNQKDKLTQEITIHRSLNHQNIVGFHGFFEDSHNVYIVLELCKKRSMMELHKRRKALTEPEVRYFMHQILHGCMFLHKQRIIHRDLKLGNLLINEDMKVKVGDFGLAARIEYDGERKRTLFGKPPFETRSLKETYARIKRCEYKIPTNMDISPQAIKMIRETLQPDPKCRPKVEDLLKDEFFSCGIDPAANPLVWISKWVDYSDKYGFGYQLCDDSVGVVFNDSTKLVMLANGINVQYIAKEGKEEYYTMTDYPSTLEKKMKLLSYFRRYMSEHLVKAGAAVPFRECDSLSRIPYLCHWFRTTSAVVMYLTNGTLQINFMNHSKMILCPLMGAVTHIDQDKNFRTFRFSSIEQNGCSRVLAACLQYATDKISLML
ncbi:Serine/threonine-protein kinase PLK1 [Blattella germanica]|nr:Serine/threonine-protein kinase PLK1 [Blattella germanica]